ncbi:MAG: HDIG domain-containing protein [Candidatus Hydrogenedentes bacterium]|nr:HDIG domain-containing protein [Candidatus Hydrogenedentota bacterium]
MIFGKYLRKRQRLSGGTYRGQSQQSLTYRERQLKRGALALAFIVLLLGVTKRLTTTSEIRVPDKDGIPADETIIAEIGFQSEDTASTREAREAAASKVPDVFRVNDEAVRSQLERFDAMVSELKAQREGLEAELRDQLKPGVREQALNATLSRVVKAHAESLIASSQSLSAIGDANLLATWLMPKPEWVRSVISAKGDEGNSRPTPMEFANLDQLTRIAKSGLEYVLSYGILKPGETGSGFSSKTSDRQILVLRERPLAGQFEEEEIPLNQALKLGEARDTLKERIAKADEGLQSVAGDAAADRVSIQDAAEEVAQLCLADTLRFDDEETRVRRETARISVEPVMKEFVPGEEIIRLGVKWTPQTRLDVQTYLAEKSRFDKQTANVLGTFLGHMILVGIILGGLERALPILAPKRKMPLRDFMLVLLVLCATILIGRVIAYFDDSGFLVPAMAAAILLAILTNARLAGLVSLLIAMLVSIQFDNNWRAMVILCTMSFTGILSITVVRRRSDMGSAAVKATIVGILAMVGIALAQDSLFSEATFRGLLAIALNGLVCLFIVPGLLSPLERLFGITTDIQLLEYSDLNNHILSRLAMEVPATYAHSLMLGQLAEAAADAIGANGLLARVCAYYHDIGKLRRPEYFVENQTGANVHDGLSPRLSARAIASHVSEGAEMARSLRLPKPLIDAIYEHHGTCLISFFYQEAVAQQKHGGVIEADFRYPGPRPRSRETAILMICDAVESAVRTLKNPNEERIRELIDRIISNRASDRQFDESDLTLKDLDTIAEVLTRRIMTSQHRRITYPDQTPKPEATNVIALSGGQDK